MTNSFRGIETANLSNVDLLGANGGWNITSYLPIWVSLIVGIDIKQWIWIIEVSFAYA